MRELIVYKRHLKTGVFFYSRFMNQKTKKYDTSFSIEKLKSLLGYETSKRTRSRGEAFRIALVAIDAGIIETAKKKEKAPELAKYVLSFWDYDNSEYIRMKNLVKPNSVGPDYANNMVETFKKTFWECRCFLGLNYNAIPSSVIYSFGLLLFKPIFILSFLNQLRYLSMKYMKSSRVQPFQSLL